MELDFDLIDLKVNSHDEAIDSLTNAMGNIDINVNRIVYHDRKYKYELECTKCGNIFLCIKQQVNNRLKGDVEWCGMCNRTLAAISEKLHDQHGIEVLSIYDKDDNLKDDQTHFGPKDKLKVRCPNGHEDIRLIKWLKTKYVCDHCRLRGGIHAKVQGIADDLGWTIIVPEEVTQLKGHKTARLHIECNNGHKFVRALGGLVEKKNYNCRDCSKMNK